MAFSSGLSSVLPNGAETIVAPATPPGHGALAILRISGSLVAAVASRVCPRLDVRAGWRAQLVPLMASDGTMLERGIVIPYPGPRSYTGEDMLEVMIHGSPAVVGAALDAFVAAGCRMARPGEFTRRAVANGKLDLAQAEAIADLVAAETTWELRAARAQLEGYLSREISVIRDGLVNLLARVEANLDFAGHEIPLSVAELAADCRAVRSTIEKLRASAAAGERIRDGARVAIVGIPNAGKSTLFNRLVRAERAIVSPHPGTTRDLIEAEVELGGVRTTLVDTAGLRASKSAIESEGVRRARAAAAEANAVVVIHPADVANGVAPPARPADLPWLGVVSKTDLDPAPAELIEEGWLPVSLTTGDGWAEVERAVGRLVSREVEALEGPVAINRRQREALDGALRELDGIDFGVPELAAEALRGALDRLAEVVGQVDREDVLDRLFSTFCIGK